MRFFFGHCGPPPLLPSRPWDEYTVSRFSFSQLVEMIHIDFQGLPLSYTIIVSLVQDTWQPYWTRPRITGSKCELLLLASCINSLLDCNPECLAYISPLATHSTLTLPSKLFR